MNSKAYQKNIIVDTQPSREELLDKAVEHMYLGKTKEESLFVSFTEDISAFMESLDGGSEASWSVRSIVRGSHPQFYGIKQFIAEQVSQAISPVGVFDGKICGLCTFLGDHSR